MWSCGGPLHHCHVIEWGVLNHIDCPAKMTIVQKFRVVKSTTKMNFTVFV